MPTAGFGMRRPRRASPSSTGRLWSPTPRRERMGRRDRRSWPPSTPSRALPREAGRGVTPEQLLRGGQLEEAIAALGTELRTQPQDAQRRTFLFELLCFAGEHERAQRQLDVVASASKEARMGALLYL